MPITILSGGAPYVAESATAEGDALWLSLAELHAATGWESKPQGLCQGDVCVPIPPARTSEFFAPDGRFNLAAFARHVGRPAVHDDAAGVWLLGEPAASRRDALRSLEAPDFTLPDLDGNAFTLSQFRGKKVLLLSWASW